MWHWLERRITANPADPIPRALTIAGLAMSAAAWAYGWFAGFGGFLLNTAAALGIVGPALLLSNVVVKALQDARGRASVRPLLQPVNRLLCDVFDATDPVFMALGYEGPRESHQALIDHPDFSTLTAQLRRTLRRMESAVSECQVEPGDIIRNIHPLSVPQFSLMSKLVLQADRHYQMPWSVTGAVIAEDWGATCGFDFVYGLPDPPLMHDRKVGLAKIRGNSESASVDARFAALRAKLLPNFTAPGEQTPTTNGHAPHLPGDHNGDAATPNGNGERRAPVPDTNPVPPGGLTNLTPGLTDRVQRALTSARTALPRGQVLTPDP